MSEHSVRKKAAIFYSILAVYFILFCAIYAGCTILAESLTEQQILTYERSGDTLRNLVPLRNLFAPFTHGYPLAGLALIIGRFLIWIPAGIAAPILNVRFRQARLIVAAILLVFLFILRPIFMGGVLDVDVIIFAILGFLIGLLLWQKLIRNKFDLSFLAIDN